MSATQANGDKQEFFRWHGKDLNHVNTTSVSETHKSYSKYYKPEIGGEQINQLTDGLFNIHTQNSTLLVDVVLESTKQFT
jgi:hypothetical protein